MNLTRHAKIIELMEHQNTISVRDLAMKLNCTEMTIRRNLDQLQEKGLVRREHGYAMLCRPGRSTDYFAEIRENAEEKTAIAAAALAFLTPGCSICLDSGTTTQMLVRQIPEGFPLSVITPSLTAAMELSSREEVQVLMPGGFLHHSNRSLLIDSPEELAKYHTDIAFVSCRSLQIPGGTFEQSQTLTNTKRALAATASKRILLADHTKWNVSSIFNCIPMEMIDIIITDHEADAEEVRKARALGKTVILA